MTDETYTDVDRSFILSSAALAIYDRRMHDAVESVTALFYSQLGPEAQPSDLRRRESCRTDICYHLAFLRPVLETGILQPYIDYLKWLSDVFVARRIPYHHIGRVLDLIGDYFLHEIPTEGRVVGVALTTAFDRSIDLVARPAVHSGALPQMIRLRDALLSADRVSALAVIDDYRSAGHSLVEAYVDLVQASLIDIGRLWQHNEISVAAEHLASMTVQSVMAGLLATVRIPEPTGRRAILACIEGNNHDFGLRMVAHVLETGGWQLQCLGADTPTPSLIDQIKRFQPELVGLSISLPSQFVSARAIVAAIRQAFGAGSPRLAIGGGAINRYPQLGEFIGADIHVQDAFALEGASL